MINRRQRWQRLMWGMLLYAVFPAAWLGRSVILESPITICWFRTVLGRPCPTCGLTRALASAVHGQWSEAFAYHPLWVVAAVVIAGVGAVALLDAITGKDRLGRLSATGPLAGWLFVGGLVIVALLRLAAASL